MARLKLNIKAAAMNAVGLGAGAYAASAINKIGPVQKMSPAIRGVIKVALGTLLPSFLAKGKTAGIVKSAGDGMVAMGVIELANGTVLKGNPVRFMGLETSTIGMPDTYVDEAYSVGNANNFDQGVIDSTIGSVPTYSTDADEQ